MSFDFAARARHPLIVLMVLVAGLLSGCQVRPLYDEDGRTQQALAAISITDAPDRITQQVRNQLIFLISGGAGESKTPEYNLRLTARSWSTDVLLEKNNDIMKTGTVFVSGSYALTRIKDGTVVKSGQRQVSAFVYFPLQEFAKIRALRDGEDRATRELAEQIRADIAAALGR